MQANSLNVMSNCIKAISAPLLRHTWTWTKEFAALISNLLFPLHQPKNKNLVYVFLFLIQL